MLSQSSEVPLISQQIRVFLFFLAFLFPQLRATEENQKRDQVNSSKEERLNENSAEMQLKNYKAARKREYERGIRSVKSNNHLKQPSRKFKGGFASINTIKEGEHEYAQKSLKKLNIFLAKELVSEKKAKDSSLESHNIERSDSVNQLTERNNEEASEYTKLMDEIKEKMRGIDEKMENSNFEKELNEEEHTPTIYSREEEERHENSNTKERSSISSQNEENTIENSIHIASQDRNEITPVSSPEVASSAVSRAEEGSPHSEREQAEVSATTPSYSSVFMAPTVIPSRSNTDETVNNRETISGRNAYTDLIGPTSISTVLATTVSLLLSKSKKKEESSS